MRRLSRALLGPVLAAALLAPTAPARADDGYDYLPGHPMYGAVPDWDQPTYTQCTGGYAVSGTSGTFLLAGNECFRYEVQARGLDREYGAPAHRNGLSTLVRMTVPGDDAFQVVVDPTTGARPGTGLVQGWMPTADQGPGVLVGKMGDGSGWTEGRVTGWTLEWGFVAICADLQATRGDYGGPVWRSDEHGLRALGTVVAVDPATGHACYRPIQDLLWSWRAWLPVFGPTVPVTGPGELAPGLPELDEGPYVPHTGLVDAS